MQSEQTYTVKPLVWVTAEDGLSESAETPFGSYYITHCHGGGTRLHHTDFRDLDKKIRTWAKGDAYAEAHWHARITQCLVLVQATSPAQPAGREGRP